MYLVVVLGVACLAVYKYLTWHYDYWRKRGVPFLSGIPPFGNVIDIVFSRRIIGEVYMDIYNNFKGEAVCGFFKMRQPVLMVRDPELIKQVLVKQFANFQDNDFHFNPKADPIFSLNPFVATGHRWREYRAVMAPTQSPGNVKSMVPCCMHVCQNMIKYLKNNPQYIECHEFMGHFTTDASAAWGLALNVNSFDNPQTKFRVETTDVFGGDFTSNLAVILSFFAPAIGDLLGFSMIRKSFVDYFTGIVKEVLERRRSTQIPQKDFIQILLDINQEATAKGKGRVLDEFEITGHALTFFYEGYINTTVTLGFILLELAKNPKIQEKTRQEIMNFGKRIDDFDYDKLHSLNYMNQVIEEAVRLHSAVPIMTRLCNKKTTLSLGNKELVVDAGTPVTIPIMAIHMDPQYFPDPETFQPDRFSEENKTSRNKHFFLGFSDGPRACVGIRIADVYLRMALTAILLNFRVIPKDSNAKVIPDPAHSWILHAKGGIWVKFEPLTP